METIEEKDTDAMLVEALAGGGAATRALVARLLPVVWSRVTRIARRARGRTSTEVNQLAEDLAQEVFAELFAEDGRALRRWDPERGLSLEGYVGLLATHRAASLLRSGRKSGWREYATEDDALTRAAGATPSEERREEARDTLARFIARLRDESTPESVRLFELLLVEGRPVGEVSGLLSTNARKLYAWRSRFSRKASRIAAELDGDVASPPADAHVLPR